MLFAHAGSPHAPGSSHDGVSVLTIFAVILLLCAVGVVAYAAYEVYAGRKRISKSKK